MSWKQHLGKRKVSQTIPPRTWASVDMPRPEAPIDPDWPLASFASSLRALRLERGITYREMARLTNYGVTALSVAAGGRYLPTLEVTLAYALSCGGIEDEWRLRWYQARDLFRNRNGAERG